MSASNRNWIKGRWFILSLVDILFSFSSRYCSCSPFQKHSASCWVNEINTNILYLVGFDFFLCVDSSLYFIFFFFFFYTFSSTLSLPGLSSSTHAMCIFAHSCVFVVRYLFLFHFVRATKVLYDNIFTEYIWIGCLIWFIWPILAWCESQYVADILMCKS